MKNSQKKNKRLNKKRKCYVIKRNIFPIEEFEVTPEMDFKKKKTSKGKMKKISNNIKNLEP